MPAITSIVIADGQATPVNHTFEVGNAQAGTVPALFRDVAEGLPRAMPTITAAVRRTDAGTTKCSLKIRVPHVNEVSGNSEVTHTEYVDIVFSLPELSTLGQRQDVLAYARNLLGHALIVDMVEDLSPAY